MQPLTDRSSSSDVAHSLPGCCGIHAPIGKNISVGKISVDLSKLLAPGEYTLVVTVGPESFFSPISREIVAGSKAVRGVNYSRQNNRDHEGEIRGYVLQVSDDGREWREVARGELLSTFAPQQIYFSSSVTARYLKLIALSGFGVDKRTALAELAVIPDAPVKKAKPKKP